METSKFEQEQARKAERAKRKKNIDYIKELIRDDEQVLQVIPADHSNLQAMSDRRIMAAHIEKLRDQLADETRLYNQTFDANESDVAEVVSNLSYTTYGQR